MSSFRAAIIVAFFFSGVPALADDVTLTSRDGSLSLDGTLLSFDGEFYRVDTEFGELTLDGSGVDCDGPGCPDLTAFVAKLRVSGSASVGTALLPALLETFAVRNGFDVQREVTSDREFTYELREAGEDQLRGAFTFSLSTSDEGFADLIADEADLVISRREISRDEAVLARQAGRGQLTDPRRSRILALDGIVPAVAIQNPAEAISIQDLRRVVAGEIDDWSALDQEAGPIELHITDPGSGLFQAFLRKVMRRSELTLPAGTVVHDDDASLADAVAENPFALGLAAFSELGNAQDLALEGPCGDRIAATVLSLKSEDYALTTPIFLYSPVRRLPRLARDFLAYANSPAAQPVIRRAGFVDQFPQAIPLDAQGQRLANAITRAGGEVTLSDLKALVAAMKGQVRLSLSFRFEGGSTILDAQSRSNVALLAEALERGVFDDRTLTFAGFSDGAGSAAANLRLSEQRAVVIHDAVRAAARTIDPSRITLRTEAFGEVLPMACDETEWGSRINRRVEVWLR
ncbi:substrate-binding domain-containing protein [Maribius pontilimi]|uniref:Substrate-binding domain-containing protein n=1 Tax=Palleronia pontilimi TaxID=1964209 RepID=A0A934IEV7_9RHOB|nr:phosphate ABC transporter substrate-binding/OmpA family protein [Palleronia pontilimi]MBJ3761593.1 substrate-binding domain-containing protein [Palleronia pontilimi]